MNRPAILCLLLALAACAPLPRGAEYGVVWRPSPNFDERRPNFVIIHATTNDSAAQALRTLTDPQRKVSAHYLIDRAGTLYQLVDERARAWHAGESCWGGQTDLNSASIGIELDNNGDEPFAEPQLEALLALLADVQQRYRIPAANFLAHADVAPRRKSDPGSRFPWKRLADQGFGLWCDPPWPAAPPAFDADLALQALGYDLSDREAALRAFHRHFLGDDSAAPLGDADQALLHCLAQRKIGASGEARLRAAPERGEPSAWNRP